MKNPPTTSASRQAARRLAWVLASVLVCFCVYRHLRPAFHVGWENTILAGMLAVGSVEFLLFAINVLWLTLIAFGRMAVRPDYEQWLEAEWSMEKGWWLDRSNWEERDSWDDRAKCLLRVEELERTIAAHQALKGRIASIDLRWGDFRERCWAMGCGRRMWWVVTVAMADRRRVWGSVTRWFANAADLLAFVIPRVLPAIFYIAWGAWWLWWKIRCLQAPFVALFTFLICRGRIDGGLGVIVFAAVVLNELLGIMWPAWWLTRGRYWNHDVVEDFARMDWGDLELHDSHPKARERLEWKYNHDSSHLWVWGSLIERWEQLPERELMSRFPIRYLYACREVAIDRYQPRCMKQRESGPGSDVP